MNSRGLNDLYAYIYTPKWPIFKLMVGVIMVSVPFPKSSLMNYHFLDVHKLFIWITVNSLKNGKRHDFVFIHYPKRC